MCQYLWYQKSNRKIQIEFSIKEYFQGIFPGFQDMTSIPSVPPIRKAIPLWDYISLLSAEYARLICVKWPEPAGPCKDFYHSREFHMEILISIMKIIYEVMEILTKNNFYHRQEFDRTRHGNSDKNKEFLPSTKISQN